MATHIQCTLRRGNIRDVCWLPSKFAVEGKYLRIKEENGWQVTGVGDLRLPSDYVEKQKNNYRSQRQASDI
jgi:hypothetical protein